MPFIEQYIAYLAPKADKQKLANFCYQVGYQHFSQTKNDQNKALKYLQYGTQAAPNDQRLLTSIGQVYQALGNPQKAEAYFARAGR